MFERIREELTKDERAIGSAVIEYQKRINELKDENKKLKEEITEIEKNMDGKAERIMAMSNALASEGCKFCTRVDFFDNICRECRSGKRREFFFDEEKWV